MRAWFTITWGVLGQAVGDVLDPAGACDAVGGVRAPEAGLIDPVGLTHQALGQPEAVEHLHGAAGDAVCVSQLEGRLAALDDQRGDLGELGQLRGKDRPGGAGAGDEYVNLFGECSRGPASGGRGADVGVARAVAILVELHGAPCSAAPWAP